MRKTKMIIYHLKLKGDNRLSVKDGTNANDRIRTDAKVSSERTLFIEEPHRAPVKHTSRTESRYRRTPDFRGDFSGDLPFCLPLFCEPPWFHTLQKQSLDANTAPLAPARRFAAIEAII